LAKVISDDDMNSQKKNSQKKNSQKKNSQKKTQLDPIHCKHSAITTTDIDKVCNECGMVIEENIESTSTIYDNVADNTANLYEIKSLGSKQIIPEMAETTLLRMFYKGGQSPKVDKDLSQFSNTCAKLQVPFAAQRYAWNEFSKYVGKDETRKIAEYACLFIYHACKKHGYPVTDDEVINAAKICFGRKKIRSMIKIGYMFLNAKKNFNKDTLEFINSYNGLYDEYYFNINWKKMTKGMELTELKYNQKKALAWKYTKSVFREGTFDKRSKRAIGAVFKINKLKGGRKGGKHRNN
jgi:hypothetical protein